MFKPGTDLEIAYKGAGNFCFCGEQGPGPDGSETDFSLDTPTRTLTVRVRCITCGHVRTADLRPGDKTRFYWLSTASGDIPNGNYGLRQGGPCMSRQHRQAQADALAQKYPHAMRDNQIADFGISAGPGWEPVLQRMYEALDAHLAKQPSRTFILYGAKEKFAGLRVYCTGGDRTTEGIIRQAEAEATKTCETCGQPGVRRTGGWLAVLCDEHHAMRETR